MNKESDCQRKSNLLRKSMLLGFLGTAGILAQAQTKITSYTTVTTPSVQSSYSSTGRITGTPLEDYFIDRSSVNPHNLYFSMFGHTYVSPGVTSVASTKILTGITLQDGRVFNRVTTNTNKPFDTVVVKRKTNVPYGLDNWFSGYYVYDSIRRINGVVDENVNTHAEDLYSYINGSNVSTMEGMLNNYSLSYGTDNLFSNKGQGAHGIAGFATNTGNNIERVDFIYRQGIGASTTAGLQGVGMTVNDRGVNDQFKIAAITALNSSDSVMSLGPVVLVNLVGLATGITDSIRTLIFTGIENADIRPKERVVAQRIGGVYISIADLGIPVNTPIYGFALFPNDITSDYLTLATAPTNTDEISGAGGLDLTSGTILLVEPDNPDVIAKSLSGKVWYDMNFNSIRDGSETNISGNGTSAGGSIVMSAFSYQLYANIVSNGYVVGVVNVAANGTYQWNGMLPNQTYSVIVSTTAATPGDSVSVSEINAGIGNDWASSGENKNGVIDGAPLSVITFNSPDTGNLVNYDFGIQQRPDAEAKNYMVPGSAFSAAPPAGFGTVPGYSSIPMSSTALVGYPTGGSLSGTDAEDCATTSSCNTGTNSTFNIETINANTKLYYDFGGSTGVQEINVAGGPIAIPNFDASKLVIYAQDGSTTQIGFTYSMTDHGGATSLPVVYTIGKTTPLAMSLLYFNISVAGKNTVNLEWTTTSENNNSGFDIERSADGNTWSKIVFVPSLSDHGNSNAKLIYMASDNHPLNGKNYYRLKQLDFDGKFQYSEIKLITIGSKEQVRIWPNPINDYVIIDGLSGTENVKLMDINGRELINDQVKGNRHTIKLDILSAGVYLIRVQREGQIVSTHKVQKLR